MSIQEKLKTLPKKPGCYLMKDKDGTVIYVGKAIILKNRVNSYFRGVHDYKTSKLVSNIKDFDYIVTNNEKEALILEYNLIKEYDPYYNVIFKDDKSYPYIILRDSKEPSVDVIRLKKRSKKVKGRLFGPYPDVGAARNTVEMINKLYPTRKCEPMKKDLCLYYHIGQCLGYCRNDVDEEKMEGMKKDILSFLTGKTQPIINDLKDRMDKFIDYLVGDPDNFVSSYIYQFYQINHKPKTLYVPKDLLPYLEGIDELDVKTVARGNKYQLINRARDNSFESLRQNKDIITSKNDYYELIRNEFIKLFGKEMKRIELFDNSHTAGTNTVAAMVVYKDLKPSKKDYRLYKLEEGADDLKSMHEVLYRRYFRVLKDSLERPDLIIVDGGRNQIETAKEVLSSLNMDIALCGLVKDDTHNTSFLLDSDLNKIDIDPDSKLFFFLANAQDEVHRFAISYHKKLRSKNTYRSLLDGIEGLGPKTRMKLLKKYKTISKIKTLELEELKTVLNEKTAVRLYNKLREENDKEPE